MFGKIVFISAICLCAFTGLAQGQMPPSANSPAAVNALEQAAAEGYTLLEQKKFQQAYELFSRLRRDTPRDARLALGLARAAVMSGHADEAENIYESLVVAFPQNTVLLRELAFTRHQQQDLHGAQTTLAQDATLSAQEREALLSNWAKNKSDRFFVSGALRMGFLYDSNANSGPASNDVLLGSWNVRLNNADAVETAALYLGGKVDLGYRLGETSPWWLVGDFSFFARYNTNSDLDDLHLRSSEWGASSVGFRHIGTKTMFDFRLKGEIFDYDFYQNIAAWGPKATFIFAPTPKVHLITEASYDRRNYSDNDGYDGSYLSAGQYARFFFGDGHNATIGGRYLKGSADFENFSYDGYEASLAFSFDVPQNFTASSADITIAPFISYLSQDYDGPATVFEVANREDNRLRTGVGFTLPLTDDGWNFELNYQYSNNSSNSDLYDYDQHTVMTGVAYHF